MIHRIKMFLELQHLAFRALVHPQRVANALMYSSTQVLERKLQDPNFKGAMRRRVQQLHAETMGEHVETSRARLQKMFQAKLAGDEKRFDELYRQHQQDV